MSHTEHAPVTVADDQWPRKSEPFGRETVIRDRLDVCLKSTTFHDTAVARAQNIVTTTVEGKEGQSQSSQHRREKPRGADVEIHRVAVEINSGTRYGTAVRLVEKAVERRGRCRDGDQFCSHFDPVNREWRIVNRTSRPC